MSAPSARAVALLVDLRQNLASVVLGTVSADGEPDASLAPCVLVPDGAFVIYVSGLAAHTRNLRAQPRASVLLLAPETPATPPLARPRLTFACAATAVARDTPEHAALVETFRAKFGPTVEVVATLPDFQFFRLQPQRGRFIAGFGAAFAVDPVDWTRLTPLGPR